MCASAAKQLTATSDWFFIPLHQGHPLTATSDRFLPTAKLQESQESRIFIESLDISRSKINFCGLSRDYFFKDVMLPKLWNENNYRGRYLFTKIQAPGITDWEVPDPGRSRYSGEKSSRGDFTCATFEYQAKDFTKTTKTNRYKIYSASHTSHQLASLRPTCAQVETLWGSETADVESHVARPASLPLYLRWHNYELTWLKNKQWDRQPNPMNLPR